jgi:hypothetical protein
MRIVTRLVFASLLALLAAGGFVTWIDHYQGAAAQQQLAQGPINQNIPAGQGNLNIAGVPQVQFGPALAQPGVFRNLLIGGDFGTNAWTRGTAFTSISTTATYTADRWFAYNSTPGDVRVHKVTTASPAGFSAVLQLGRTPGSVSTGTLCLAQILESASSAPLAGSQATLSYYARIGANFSGASNRITSSIVTGTSTDQSSTLFVAGTWAGQATAQATVQTLTTTWQRYVQTVTLGSTVTQLGVKLCYTAVGTAGAADYVQVGGLQLEQAPTVSPFERRSTGIENLLQARFAQIYAEGGMGVPIAWGQVATTTTCRAMLPLPVPMRIAPTASISLGTIRTSFASGGQQTLSTLAASGANTPSLVNLLGTVGVASLTAGNSCMLMGGGSASPAGVVLLTGEL